MVLELTYFNDYFYIDNIIDEESMCPVIVFRSKKDEIEYSFTIPAIDVMDYTMGVKSDSINNMLVKMKSIIREEKLNEIIK